VTVEQLALTASQIADWGLPTRPTKKTDRKRNEFISRFGDISVELDAIDPPDLVELVDQAIMRHMDERQLVQQKIVEAAQRDVIREAFDFTDVDDDDQDDNS
jgi:hypothetical protein